MFSHDCTDVVIVSSDHALHADHIIGALSRGKAVFAEQPLATDLAQIQKIGQLFHEHEPVPLCVNFYRSFSPFIAKIKRVTDHRATPLTISYRMNVSLSDAEQHRSMRHGAGRILGDAGHIIDLFVYLTQAKPMSVSVESLHGARTDIFPTENFIATISFSDGSLCSLLYTVQGHEHMGSERMELFFDGKSIIMDDYVGLYGFGTPSWLNETVSTPDYGRSWLIEAFFKALKQDTFVPPIPFDRLATTARLTLTIDQLACEGGGVHKG
jgi:predicted dehydrogenase